MKEAIFIVESQWCPLHPFCSNNNNFPFNENRGERMINVRVAGRSFLYNQVRNMVAALVQVGQGRLQPDDIKTILEAKDRSKAPPTAPPQGLFLESVGYAPESLVFDSLRPQEPLAVTEL